MKKKELKKKAAEEEKRRKKKKAMLLEMAEAFRGILSLSLYYLMISRNQSRNGVFRRTDEQRENENQWPSSIYVGEHKIEKNKK